MGINRSWGLHIRGSILVNNRINPEEILNRIGYKDPIAFEDLAEGLNCKVDAVVDMIDELQNRGYGLIFSGDGVLQTRVVEGKKKRHDHSKLLGSDFEIGVCGDSHLGSKKERLDALEAMYDIYADRGITHVYHTGDISEGWGIYRGQEFEVSIPGQEEQIDYVVNVYPKRKGITTSFICGNHDLRQYERGGVDPGNSIAHRRDDLKYLGQMGATVELMDGLTMELLHPGGGNTYALSYKAQKYIHNLAVGDLPDILCFGHYHTSYYMHYRGIHFLQVPAFKDQGTWEKRLGLNPTIGAWIVSGSIKGGVVTSFKPELYTF